MAQSTKRVYQILLGTVLNETWQEWFEGLIIQPQTDGTTLLIGAIKDQAQMQSILLKIQSLNLELLSVNYQQEDVQEV